MRLCCNNVKFYYIYKNNKAMSECLIDPKELNNLKIEFSNSAYTVTLIDQSQIEILKGYGDNIVSAINDMHHNLL